MRVKNTHFWAKLIIKIRLSYQGNIINSKLTQKLHSHLKTTCKKHLHSLPHTHPNQSSTKIAKGSFSSPFSTHPSTACTKNTWRPFGPQTRSISFRISETGNGLIPTRNISLSTFWHSLPQVTASLWRTLLNIFVLRFKSLKHDAFMVSKSPWKTYIRKPIRC